MKVHGTDRTLSDPSQASVPGLIALMEEVENTGDALCMDDRVSCFSARDFEPNQLLVFCLI